MRRARSCCGLDDDALSAALSRNIADPKPIIEAYRSARETRGATTDAAALFAAIETDRVFRLPAIHLSEALAERDQASYQYLFTWESPYGDGNLGSCHAIDIGFVFGTHEMSEGSAEFFGAGEDADRFAGEVQDAWLGFARTGNPRTEALSEWAPYEADKRSTAVFGATVEVVDAPLDAERAAWTSLDAATGGL